MELSEQIQKLATECTYPDDQRLQVLICQVAELARTVETLTTAPPSTSELIRAAAKELYEQQINLLDADQIAAILSRFFGKGETELRRNPRVNALLVALRKVRDNTLTLDAARELATIAIEEYVDAAAPASPSPVTEADVIVLEALETHGSEVIFNSEHGIVEYCPVSSACSGTPNHEPECWIGRALQYMPTSDCERALAAAALRTSVREGGYLNAKLHLDTGRQ